MQIIQNHKSLWRTTSPWILLGIVLLLLLIFTLFTFENVRQLRSNSIRLMVEKGAALIRAFEAGSRSGMRGHLRRGFRIQHLLSETAKQDDILHLIVIDRQRNIIAHSDPARIGQTYATGLDLDSIVREPKTHWRRQRLPDNTPVFEVYRHFSPTGSGHGPRRMEMCPPPMDKNQPESPYIIFVGMDMTAVENTRRIDVRHTIILGGVLLLVSIGGTLFLLMAQGYRTTRALLSRVQAFSDTLVEHMPIGLIAIDSRERIVSLNQGAADVFDFEPSQILGKRFVDILPAPLGDKLLEMVIASTMVEFEIECDLKNGRHLPLEIRASNLTDGSGTLAGRVFLIRDLSEIRALRHKIERNRRLVSVGKLAAGVAHEIRNPLSSIKGFATYFKERSNSDSEDLYIAEIMIAEVERLNRVIGQLLNLAKPAALRKTTIDLVPLMQDTIKMIETKAQANHITIDVNLGQDPILANADADRIRQMLLNLYLNAIESIVSKGRLYITLSLDKKKRSALITIKDSGKGIFRENLPHIFDPYYTTKASGSGLGLSIVHGIVEAHNGQIRVLSTPEAGTKFTITLPLSGEEPKKRPAIN